MKEFPGLAQFVDEVAGEMKLVDSQHERPVLTAKGTRPIRLVENQISQAANSEDPVRRAAVLGHARTHLAALRLLVASAERMLRWAYDRAKLPHPEWLTEPTPKARKVDPKPASPAPSLQSMPKGPTDLPADPAKP